MHIVDLFCGAGGFSHGATLAGATVILAVDSWKEALDVHAANHPACEHWCEEVGGDPAAFADRLKTFVAARAPEDGHVHLHASPPCQNLSTANHSRIEAEGHRLVDWALRVIELFSPRTFTLEQVCNAAVLRRYGNLPHGVYRMQHHGVPQTRTRIIVGFAPVLDAEEPVTMREVLSECGYDVEDGDKQSVGNQGVKAGVMVRRSRSLDEVAGTVRQRWPAILRDGRYRALPIEVMVRLQTFPPGYFDSCSSSSPVRKMIGNAVPPAFARRVVAKAIAKATEEAS